MEFKEFYKTINEKKLENVYFFTGEEEYYIEHSIKHMENTLLSPGFKDMNYKIYRDSGLSVEKLVAEIETIPFFDEKRIIVLEDTKIFSNKKTLSENEEKMIIECIKNIPETSIIIFREKDVDKRKKFYKNISKKATTVKFSKLTESKLTNWAGKKIQENGKKIDGRDLNYLIKRTGYMFKDSKVNLYDVENSIKSICGVTEEEIIEKSSIDMFIKTPIEDNIFLMTNSLNSKDIETALLILDKLIENKESEIKILALISSQYRNMYKTKVLLKSGYTSKIISSKLGVHQFAIQKLAGYSNKYSERELKYIVEKIKMTDYMMKRSSTSNRTLLEVLFFDIYSYKA